MIYTLHIECVGGMYLEAPFARTIEIDSASTLDTLHDVIQSLAGFDRDHCYDYAIARNSRGAWETLAGEDDPVAAFAKITLADIFPVPKGRHFFYWFDFGDDWKFKIALKKKGEKAPKVEYPRVIAETGPAPVQYPNFEEEEQVAHPRTIPEHERSKRYMEQGTVLGRLATLRKLADAAGSSAMTGAIANLTCGSILD